MDDSCGGENEVECVLILVICKEMCHKLVFCKIEKIIIKLLYY